VDYQYGCFAASGILQIAFRNFVGIDKIFQEKDYTVVIIDGVLYNIKNIGWYAQEPARLMAAW